MSTCDRRRTPTASLLRGPGTCWEGRTGVPHIGPMCLHAGHRSYRRRMQAPMEPARTKQARTKQARTKQAQPSALGSPEDARARLRDYVRALHRAYLGGARLLAPGEHAALPLLAAPRVTVIVAAARHLHVIAATDLLPVPQGQEVAELITAERLGLHHSLRLLAAALARGDQGVAVAIDGDDDAAVRRAVLAAARSAAGSAGAGRR